MKLPVSGVDGSAEGSNRNRRALTLADRTGQCKGITAGGYLLANLARPFFFISGAWAAIVAIRFIERVGKGLPVRLYGVTAVFTLANSSDAFLILRSQGLGGT